MSKSARKKRRRSFHKQESNPPVVREYVIKREEPTKQKENPLTVLFKSERARLTFSLAFSIALSVYGSSFSGTEGNPGILGTNLARYLTSSEKSEVVLIRSLPTTGGTFPQSLAPSLKGTLSFSFPQQETMLSGTSTRGSLAEIETVSSEKTHVVQPGDTLTRIAHRYGVDALELARLNNIENINLIQRGQVLQIPDRQQPYIIPITEEEIELFQRLVEAEAGSEPFLGKVAVAAVVINRVLAPGFPNTVRDVIYEPRQFQPVSNGRINRVRPSEESISAVYAALAGVDPLRGSLFFYNPAISDPVMGEWHTTREPTGIIGQHHFSR